MSKEEIERELIKKPYLLNFMKWASELEELSLQRTLDIIKLIKTE